MSVIAAAMLATPAEIALDFLVVVNLVCRRQPTTST
jgi:hypothetical protein